MWISERRWRRMEELLDAKQPCLKVLLDGVHDSRNISAVMRSAEAVGVLDFYYALELAGHVKTHRTVTQGAHRWLRKARIATEKRVAFLRALREEGYQIVVTELGEGSVDFRTIDYTRPTLLVFGNEKEGVSPELSSEATHRAVIPMHGMVQSLNVSVAAALLLYEAERQRVEAGYYETPRLDAGIREELLEEWSRRDGLLRRSRGRLGM